MDRQQPRPRAPPGLLQSRREGVAFGGPYTRVRLPVWIPGRTVLRFDSVIARLNRDLLDPRTYTRIGYLLLAGVLGIIEFVFLVTALSTGVGLAVTLVGIPILIGSVYAWGWMAGVERRIISALTGNHIASPYRPLPEGGWWVRLRARLGDPATWKDLTFLFLQFPFGLLSFIVALTVLS